MRDRKMGKERVGKAVGEEGYGPREVADYLRLPYSTLSRKIKEREKSKNKTRSSLKTGGAMQGDD